MNESAVTLNRDGRDSAFSIVKAIAIMFVVIAHACGPSWLGRTAYIFNVPVFFMCAGYFFNLRYVNDVNTFVWRRFKNLYCPFWIWAVVFLILHNFFFWIGILSEEYGNAAGGVLHPYSWHAFCQRLWSVTFNMSGYDEFLCGAFWFFRTLFVSSIAFLLLYKLIAHFTKLKQPVHIALTIVCLSWLLALWQVEGNLRITGLAQGGYRELMALIFMGLGFVYHRFQRIFSPHWLVALIGFSVLALFSWQSPSAMSYKADLTQFLSLPVPAFAAFVSLHVIAKQISKYKNRISETLVYIGDRTLYIFAFHLLAFKVVSILKVLVYDLPWSHVGGHTVVHDEVGGIGFFLLYVIVGISLPLLTIELWKKMDSRYNLTWLNCLKYSLNAIFVTVKFIYNLIKKMVLSFWHGLVNFYTDMKTILKASNPKEDE